MRLVWAMAYAGDELVIWPTAWPLPPSVPETNPRFYCCVPASVPTLSTTLLVEKGQYKCALKGQAVCSKHGPRKAEEAVMAHQYFVYL